MKMISSSSIFPSTSQNQEEATTNGLLWPTTHFIKSPRPGIFSSFPKEGNNHRLITDIFGECFSEAFCKRFEIDLMKHFTNQIVSLKSNFTTVGYTLKSLCDKFFEIGSVPEEQFTLFLRTVLRKISRLQNGEQFFPESWINQEFETIGSMVGPKVDVKCISYQFKPPEEPNMSNPRSEPMIKFENNVGISARMHMHHFLKKLVADIIRVTTTVVVQNGIVVELKYTGFISHDNPLTIETTLESPCVSTLTTPACLHAETVELEDYEHYEEMESRNLSNPSPVEEVLEWLTDEEMTAACGMEPAAKRAKYAKSASMVSRESSSSPSLKTEKSKKCEIKHDQKKNIDFDVFYIEAVRTGSADKSKKMWTYLLKMDSREILKTWLGPQFRFVEKAHPEVFEQMELVAEWVKRNRANLTDDELRKIASYEIEEGGEQIRHQELRSFLKLVLTKLFTLKFSERFKYAVPFYWICYPISMNAQIDAALPLDTFSPEMYSDKNNMLAMGPCGVFGAVEENSLPLETRRFIRQHMLKFHKQLICSLIRKMFQCKLAKNKANRTYIYCFVYDGKLEPSFEEEELKNENRSKINWFSSDVNIDSDVQTEADNSNWISLSENRQKYSREPSTSKYADYLERNDL